MTKKEFIKKWNVAYLSREEEIEFKHEMMKDLVDVIEYETKKSVLSEPNFKVCENCKKETDWHHRMCMECLCDKFGF